jgi:hypothetical protein
MNTEVEFVIKFLLLIAWVTFVIGIGVGLGVLIDHFVIRRKDRYD